MKKFLAVLALLAFGAPAVHACQGQTSMKDASSSGAVPQQSKPAPQG